MSKIVNRTLDFFELFARQQQPLSLTELMKALDIPMSSCHDVVRALEARGYLYEVKARGGYYPTARLYHVSKAIVENDPVGSRAEPILLRLSRELNASVMLSHGKGDQQTYLVSCSSPTPLRFDVKVGDSVRNFYATSAGKAYLASFPIEERKRIVAGMTLTPLTPATNTSKAVLLKELEEGNARGWFTNREESVEDALTLSARFKWNDAIYVITASSTVRLMERQWDTAVKAITQAAAELSGGN